MEENSGKYVVYDGKIITPEINQTNEASYHCSHRRQDDGRRKRRRARSSKTKKKQRAPQKMTHCKTCS